MKKLLLAAALLGMTLPHSAVAKAPTQTKRKKSKEIALIKAIAGSYIAYTRTSELLSSLLQIFGISQMQRDCPNERTFINAAFMKVLIPGIPLSILPTIVALIIAKQGFDDLDEIAQEEQVIIPIIN